MPDGKRKGWPDFRFGPSRSAIPATVWMVGFVSLLMDVSSEMINTLLPLYLAGGLGASALAIGFIEGISVAIATASKFLSGVLADFSRRAKPIAVLGYGLAALSRLIFPLATSVDLIVLARAMDRVGKGIRGAPRDAIVAAVTPQGMRGASFGLRKSLDTVGGFLGPLIAIAAMLLLAGDIVTVFWLAALPAGMAVAVLIFAVREPAESRAEIKNIPAFRFADAFRLNPAIWTVICLAGVIMLARFSEAFLLLKSVEAGFSLTWVPVSIVIMHGVYGLCAYPVGKLSDTIGNTGLLLCSLVFLVVAHLTIAFSATVWEFVIGIVFWGLHMGFSQGLLGAMVADASPAGLRASAFGAFNLVTGIVLLIGNVAAGWLWQDLGSHAPFIAGALLSLFAFFAIAVLQRKTNR